jgi:hypothetical protein
MMRRSDVSVRLKRALKLAAAQRKLRFFWRILFLLFPIFFFFFKLCSYDPKHGHSQTDLNTFQKASGHTLERERSETLPAANQRSGIE